MVTRLVSVVRLDEVSLLERMGTGRVMHVSYVGDCHDEVASMKYDYQRYISRNPAICGGEPVVTGTRVTVRIVLASLAEGMSVEEILADFPSLTEEAVRAVIAFAAVSAEEDLPLPGVPTPA